MKKNVIINRFFVGNFDFLKFSNSKKEEEILLKQNRNKKHRINCLNVEKKKKSKR